MNNLSVFEAIEKSVENDKIFFDKKQRKDIVQLANSPRKKKAAMNKIIEIANDIVYGPDCDIDNSIINCAWCGPVSENTRFELSNSGVGCYINDEYCDFDECSYALYTWIAYRCNQKLKEMDSVISKNIVGFKVVTRGENGVKNYQFALKAIRKNVNISDTLIILESCYKNGFDVEEAIKDDVITITKKGEGTMSKAVQLLIEGVCRYKEWFTLFGEKEEGYRNYIKFWELESFE